MTERVIELSEMSHQKLALLASGLEIQRDELLAALKACVAVAKSWHDMDGSDVWELYYRHSPEMQPIRDALSKYRLPA